MKKQLIYLFLGGLMISSMGCMTTPINNAYVGYRVTNFEGFELDPGMSIEIQAWNVLDAKWEKVAEATSRLPYSWETPLVDPASGLEFYRWKTPHIYLLPKYWQPVPPNSELVSCRIRGLREDGRLVGTYNQHPDWSDGGAIEDFGKNGNPGKYITIFSN
ncbi:hypothetical protein OAG51_01455 [Pirellulaceae bacterium]|nr:hypothetical protein [Pirellulaceae bacterium]